MSLGDLFTFADSQYQALIKNPPRNEPWSVVVLASFAYPYWVANMAPTVRGRLEYSPAQAVQTKVGNRSVLLLSPAKFSGLITGTRSDGVDVSNPQVSVSIAAPTALNFQAGKYLVEVAEPDPVSGSINVSVSVSDNPNSPNAANNANAIPGQIQMLLLEANGAESTLILWGTPYQYPIPVFPPPHR